MPKSLLRSLVTLAALGTLWGCGAPNQNAHAVRPANPTAADARGSQSVYVIEAEGQPLIVDWQPETRGDLEVAMHDGVAVVGFDAKGLRLLKDCHLPGKYGFVGVNTKEHVVRLESTDEVKANLPAAGLGIIAKLGTELGRSQVLDVAIVMIGKKRTTWATAARDELEGNCAGATHFVRGATIGAFAMRSGAKGKLRTVAEVFGGGASADVSGAKSVETADGLLDACKKSAPDAETPPPQCGALIRLELIKLGDKKVASAGKTPSKPEKEPKLDASDAVDACPAGFVFTNGKCARPTTETTHVCKLGDVRDCTLQCDKGNAESCDLLGYMFSTGTNGVSKNEAEAYKLFDKACTAAVPTGCLNLGIMVYNGLGTAKDPARGLQLFEQACNGGSGLGCRYAGEVLYFGNGVPRDEVRSVKLTHQACRAGEKFACSTLGYAYQAGMGVPQNKRVAAGLYSMACDGGAAIGCGNLAFMHETGEGVPKDEKRAFQLYNKACAADTGQCIWLGVAHHVGLGGKRDEKRALAEYKKTCANAIARGRYETQGENAACILMNELKGEKNFLEPVGLENSILGWNKACQSGTVRECTLLGLGTLGKGNPDGKKLVKEACKSGDTWACELAKHPRMK